MTRVCVQRAKLELSLAAMVAVACARRGSDGNDGYATGTAKEIGGEERRLTVGCSDYSIGSEAQWRKREEGLIDGGSRTQGRRRPQRRHGGSSGLCSAVQVREVVAVTPAVREGRRMHGSSQARA